eukprot:gene2962-3406_t
MAKPSKGWSFKSIFQLPQSVKSKMVDVANVAYFSVKTAMNVAWIAATLAILIITPLGRAIEYERVLQQSERRAKNDGKSGNIAGSLPAGLVE